MYKCKIIWRMIEEECGDAHGGYMGGYGWIHG